MLLLYKQYLQFFMKWKKLPRQTIHVTHFSQSKSKSLDLMPSLQLASTIPYKFDKDEVSGIHISEQVHQMFKAIFAENGPFVKIDLAGRRSVIHICDPASMKVVYKLDSLLKEPSPSRSPSHLQSNVRDYSEMEQDLDFNTSTLLKRTFRNEWFQTFLSFPVVQRQTKELIKITRDLNYLMSQQKEFMNIKSLLLRWAIESLSYITMENRLGLLNEKAHYKHFVFLFRDGAIELSMLLYEVLVNLATNTEKQHKLRMKLKSYPNLYKLKRNSYLFQVVKESIRLFQRPIIDIRKLRSSLILGGFHFPINTMVCMHPNIAGVINTYVEDAELFLPERFGNHSKRKYDIPVKAFEDVPSEEISIYLLVIAVANITENFQIHVKEQAANRPILYFSSI